MATYNSNYLDDDSCIYKYIYIWLSIHCVRKMWSGISGSYSCNVWYMCRIYKKETLSVTVHGSEQLPLAYLMLNRQTGIGE